MPGSLIWPRVKCELSQGLGSLSTICMLSHLQNAFKSFKCYYRIRDKCHKTHFRLQMQLAVTAALAIIMNGFIHGGKEIAFD